MQVGPTPPCILTIEDDAVLRESMVAWLEDEGYDVMQASDGFTALSRIIEHMPDLVLLDLGIPGIDGEDLLGMLTQKYPDLPVVIVSGRAEIGDAIAAFKLGAWDYVTKPLQGLDMLGVTISKCLERHRLKALLASAETRYHQLVQHLPVLVFALDEGLNLTFINNSARSILGWPPHEALDTPGWFVAHVHGDDIAQVRAAFTQAMRNPSGSFGLEFRFMHRSGYPVPLQARFTYETPPGQDTGVPGRIEGVLVDLTERIFLERLLGQQERLNTLTALTDEVAHEFRNPVFTLGGFARALKRRYPESPEADVILGEAEKLEHLLDGIHARLMPVASPPRPCHLDEIAGFCVDMMRPIAVRRALGLSFDGAPHLPPILGDEDLLTQMLLALQTTALDNVRQSGVVHLKVMLVDDVQRLRLSFSLEDSPASSPGTHDGQDVSSYTRSLAVAHRLARQLGCTLTITREGGEMVFTLEVPDRPPHPEQGR